MTLRFTPDTSEPTVWTPTIPQWRNVLESVHRLMRDTPHRDDCANDWTPDFTRDCQGKGSG